MAASSVEAREHAQNLIAKKDEMEAEIKALFEVLESQSGVGMTGPLIDEEGYPRNDIDVYSVRTARHEIICLQNDHKALMVEIEQALHTLHGIERQQREQGTYNPIANGSSNGAASIPFAKVDLVSQGSPAEKAGVCVGDRITEFGSVTSANFKSIRDIAPVVQHSQGKAVRIVVLREEDKVVISLTPQTWSGRGLLGCNIIPIR
ncbi:26S proteasome non-ATPase regulatory subunit 9 [Strongylocentrotus purpuratus]|uniref:26S proteasome non-ATPase regulatory subunit 9 n=1 Tax=Strongylocentrotus purpuratus TaxID=7668 RepID=A0A7M7RBY4_STRPU|nr:26S proteasome non-ATPase regulatory subunit 9 [Strongylocentrotus purpuratus]|eukprot:XP_785837.1 PREDICTED: 26S proteasome non-ATPase regulatory subunit 9 [Strongylocentrotus purpuratus]